MLGYAACQIGLMGKGHGKEIGKRAAAAVFAVLCAKDHTFQTCVDGSACAHGTWFKGDIERAVCQMPTAAFLTSLFNGKHLCMGKGAFVCFTAVKSGCNDLSVLHDHCADRHFTVFCG